MVEANIRIALGEYTDLKSRFNRGAAIRFIQSSVGVIKSIKGIDAVKKDSNVIEFVLLKRVGDKISEIRNSLDSIGYVITQGNTREEAVRFCEQAVEKIQFEME